MKKCRGGVNFICKWMTDGGFCTLSKCTCSLQEECAFGVDNCVEPYPPLIGVTPTEELKPQVIMGKRNEAPVVAAGVGVKVGSDDKNKIKICCDEITLAKDSVGIEVNIQNLIQNIDKFETIEINGRVFKRVKDEND